MLKFFRIGLLFFSLFSFAQHSKSMDLQQKSVLVYADLCNDGFGDYFSALKIAQMFLAHQDTLNFKEVYIYLPESRSSAQRILDFKAITGFGGESFPIKESFLEQLNYESAFLKDIGLIWHTTQQEHNYPVLLGKPLIISREYNHEVPRYDQPWVHTVNLGLGYSYAHNIPFEGVLFEELPSDFFEMAKEKVNSRLGDLNVPAIEDSPVFFAYGREATQFCFAMLQVSKAMEKGLRDITIVLPGSQGFFHNEDARSIIEDKFSDVRFYENFLSGDKNKAEDRPDNSRLNVHLIVGNMNAKEMQYFAAIAEDETVATGDHTLVDLGLVFKKKKIAYERQDHKNDLANAAALLEIAFPFSPQKTIDSSYVRSYENLKYIFSNKVSKSSFENFKFDSEKFLAAVDAALSKDLPKICYPKKKSSLAKEDFKDADYYVVTLDQLTDMRIKTSSMSSESLGLQFSELLGAFYPYSGQNHFLLKLAK